MLRAARFFMLPKVADGKYPVNKLLEILITFIALSGVDCSSWNSPLSLLKLTSRITMLDCSSSGGSPPENELPDRLRLNSLVMPSQKQQFVSFCHDVLRPEA